MVLPKLPKRNPFVPSAGRPPPVMAGRDGVIERMRAVALEPLRKGDPCNNAILLHGPRGNGKTCLLADLAKTALANEPHGGRAIDVVRLSRRDFAGMDVLTESLCVHGREPGSAVESQVGGGVQWAGVGGHVNVSLRKTRPRHLSTNALGAIELRTRAGEASGRRHSLLILVDEIHEMDGQDALSELLGGVQAAVEADANLPVGLVMAGTPDAYDVLLRTHATFVERMVGGVGDGNMPLGGISEEAIQKAIFAPFEALGRLACGAAVERAINECDGYPYFAQAWGKALYGAMLQSDPCASVIEERHVQAAAKAFEASRGLLHRRRYQELAQHGVLESAVCVMLHFHQYGHLDSFALQECIEQGLDLRDNAPYGRRTKRLWVDDIYMARERILHSGLVWGDDGATSEKFGLGIPCLASHVLLTAAQRHTHIREATPKELLGQADAEEGPLAAGGFGP